MKNIGDTSEQPSENSRGIDALCGKATSRGRSLKMSLSPRTPNTPGARFPEANARINYEPCSNSRTEERRARQERTEPRREVVTLITVEAGTPPGFYVPSFLRLFLSFPVLSRPLFYFCFEALFNFCREIFPPRNDYCSPEIAEMDEENRIRLRTFLPSDDVGMQRTRHVKLCAKTFGKKIAKAH